MAVVASVSGAALEPAGGVVTGSVWCGPCRCPVTICGGPHYRVVTDFGVETVKVGHDPLGTPLNPEDRPAPA